MKTMRLLLVPSALVICASSLYTILLGALWLNYQTFTPSLLPEDRPNAYWFLVVLCGTGFAMGVARARMFHPALHPNYARWLAATPWHAPQPLPLGPVFLVWQDALPVIVLFVAAHFHLHFPGLAPVSIFLLGYAVTTLFTLGASGQGAIAALLLFLLPAAALMPFSEEWVAGVAVGGYIIAAWGVQRGLRHFPWKLLDHSVHYDAGWPLSVLGQVETKGVSAAKCLLISGLLGWWMFCVLVNCDLTGQRGTCAGLAVVVGVGIALLRWAAYIIQTRPPLSWLGRLVTGHLLIPRYDRVLVGPLVVAAASILAGSVVGGVPFLPAGCALAVVLIFLPALLIGPTSGEWKLTGAYSMIRPRQLPQNTKRNDKPAISGASLRVSAGR